MDQNAQTFGIEKCIQNITTKIDMRDIKMTNV